MDRAVADGIVKAAEQPAHLEVGNDLGERAADDAVAAEPGGRLEPVVPRADDEVRVGRQDSECRHDRPSAGRAPATSVAAVRQPAVHEVVQNPRLRQQVAGVAARVLDADGVAGRDPPDVVHLLEQVG